MCDMTLSVLFTLENVQLLVITHVIQLVDGYSHGLPICIILHHDLRVFIPESHDYQNPLHFGQDYCFFADMTMQIAPAHKK